MKLLFRPPTEMRGAVKDVELEVNPDVLVESVRQRVEKKLGVDEPLKLSLHGKTLDDERPLRFYDVKESDAITIQPKHYNSYLPRGVQPEKRKAEDDEDVVQVDAPKQPRLLMDPSLMVEEATVPREGFTFKVGVVGEQGPRRQMEDAHLVCPSLRAVNAAIAEDRDFAVFAVFDGHGGKQTSQFARQALPAELAKEVVKHADDPLTDKTIRQIMRESFARVDHRIATELPGVADGSCAVVMLSLGETCWIANLGDSGAILARSGGPESWKAIPLANHHTCYTMKEKERILRMGGAVDNGRINGILEVSRAFGDIHLKKFGVISNPELMKVTVDPEQDKFIVMGCDGFFTSQPALDTVEVVSDHITQDEDRVANEGGEMNVNAICTELVKHMLEEKKVQDNVTCMLLVVQPK